MAGRGGLNLTHSEPLDDFIKKYGTKSEIPGSVIQEFPPQELRNWCESLGQKTFIGSSGRIFPESFKASPLLRAWISRLEKQGVRFMFGYDWQGWEEDAIVFKNSGAPVCLKPDATLLALGGASWPRLGTDGSWVEIFEKENIGIAPLQPANCGFFVEWSDLFRRRFAGQPLKSVAVSFGAVKIQGEVMISSNGIEGGAVYALSSLLREEITVNNTAYLVLDLKPDLDLSEIKKRLEKPRRGASFSNYLRKYLNLSSVAVNILMENPEWQNPEHYDPEKLAHSIKHFPLTLLAPFPLERAISTAGGVLFESVDQNFMLLKKPGVFVAGEMLDWEAPTGGYLLQADFATAVRAARGIQQWLSGRAV